MIVTLSILYLLYNQYIKEYKSIKYSTMEETKNNTGLVVNLAMNYGGRDDIVQAVNKLIEYNLVTEIGRLDAPGRPGVYEVTENFLKMFGISSLDELPELPRYKLDENEQIVIEDVMEAPMPAREDEDIENKEENIEE